MNVDNKPRYVISVAAEILKIQTYTLRYYEKIGIIKPARSVGNIRLYSDHDLIMVNKVRTLMDELGVNLAGVEVIMRMNQQLAELQREKEQIETELARLRKIVEEHQE